jgi:glycosyltransferase A (GT-A) superfamily protein (DUF2064 family)
VIPPEPNARLMVLAKAPIAGRVKTRLSPYFRPAEAAELACAALQDTLDAVETAIAILAADGVLVEPVIALDGLAGDWLPSAFRITGQRGRGLDERLAAAVTEADGPCVLIGMDTPQISPTVLVEAVTTVLGPDPCADAALGLARDGGWWLLALRRPDPALLLGLPMSTGHTGAATIRRLEAAGLRLRVDLPVLTDVDTPADVDSVADQIPGSRFSAVRNRLGRLAS